VTQPPGGEREEAQREGRDARQAGGFFVDSGSIMDASGKAGGKSPRPSG
jgi:hypothetical protein